MTTTKITNNFQKRFLVFILLLLLVSLIIFASPFIIDLLIAGILVAAVYPVHKRVLKLFSFSRTFGAIMSMILVTVVVLLPFTLFAVFIGQQAGDAYTAVSENITQIVSENDVNNPSQFIAALPFADRIEAIFSYLPVSTDELLTTVEDSLGQISSFLLSQTSNVLKGLSLFLIHVIVFLMALFYFLRDGDKLVSYLKSLLPLSKTHREELFQKLGNLSYGIIYGIFGAAILQGLLVGVAFHFAGFSNAAFWGVIAMLFSPVPYIGTMVVWLPALVILLIGGNWIAAIIFGLWCIGVVGTADNIIKPYLIGASSALNPMALLVVLLGGTFVFGLKGLIFGPFILTLTLSFLHIYQLEFKTELDGKTASTSEKTKPEKKKMKPVLKRLVAKKK